jgi:hypothetical protein
MRPKGCMKYVPPNLLDELNIIKKEDNLDKDVDALKEMVNYSAFGRQAKKEQWIFLKQFRKNE